MSRVVVGLGNRHRGDDGAGAEVAGRVRTVRARELSDPSRLMEVWNTDDDVIIVDAVSSDAPAGTIHRIEIGDSPLPLTSATSSHALGLAEVVELARSLRRLPRSVRVYGIEADTLEPGAPMSPHVAAAVEEVVREIDGA